MKICKVYSNDENRFHNIEFHDGLNVVLAEITDKSKTDKDTHNLGKTLLISVIDFLLLGSVGKKDNFFLTKGCFEGLYLFIEIKLNNGKHLVIRRGADLPSKISFKLNVSALKGFQASLDWDNEDMPFERSREILDDYLGYDVVSDWNYRKTISYFLRTQNDFRDVFRLDKFKGKDKDWKPMMFAMLGFDGAVVEKKYLLDEYKGTIKSKIETLSQEADINVEEIDKVLGLLDIKREARAKIESTIDRFNFYEQNSKVNQLVVDNIDYTIQVLNSKKYSLSVDIKNIEESLKSSPSNIDIAKLKTLYNQIGIHFPDTVKKNLEDLLLFNKSISTERNKVLIEKLDTIKRETEAVSQKLRKLEEEKGQMLAFLTEKDSYYKFKEIQKQFSKIEAEISILENKLDAIENARGLSRQIEEIETEIKKSIDNIAEQINLQKHSEIRKLFNEFIDKILNTNALLSVKQNSSGNVDFEAEIQNPANSVITSESGGMTYKKLLCIAFDLAILAYYSNKFFYRFAYHDGALEALDNRKKILFLSTVRDVCQRYGLQYILTTIDSDLPRNGSGEVVEFADNEICLKLHDRDDSGKLFKKSF